MKVERGFDIMVQKQREQTKKQANDEQVKHQGVLAYTHKIKKGKEKDSFYDDALNKAFYEMYVLA